MNDKIKIPKNRNNFYTPSMKTIKEARKKALGQVINHYLTSDWIFEKWYEKLALVGMVALSVMKIWSWIF